jgi:transcriptional regulator with XRE-family HTH domain
VSKSSDRQRDAIIEHLAALFKERRLRQGVSLNEVASRAGLSHTMVMRVEKGERLPTIGTLLRIAEALDVNLATLLQRAIRAAKSRAE